MLNIKEYKMKIVAYKNRCMQKFHEYATSKYAVVVLIIVAFTESSFFVVPPDLLLIPMAFALPKRALWYAFLTTIFSVLGGIFGYGLGFFLYEEFLKNFLQGAGYWDSFLEFNSFYDSYGAVAIFIAGFTPIPYKIATIASGVFHSNLIVFIVTSLASRGLRFFLLAGLILVYHKKGKAMVAKHFKVLVLASTMVIVVIGVVYIFLI